MIEKPTLSEISKYIPPSDSLRYRNRSPYCYLNSVLGKDNSSIDTKMTKSIMNIQSTDQCAATVAAFAPKASNDLLQFIEKQEGYIEQLERESKFCRVLHYFFCRVFIRIT